MNEVCTVEPYICGSSARNLLYVICLTPRVWRWFLDFWKISATLVCRYAVVSRGRCVVLVLCAKIEVLTLSCTNLNENCEDTSSSDKDLPTALIIWHILLCKCLKTNYRKPRGVATIRQEYANHRDQLAYGDYCSFTSAERHAIFERIRENSASREYASALPTAFFYMNIFVRWQVLRNKKRVGSKSKENFKKRELGSKKNKRNRIILFEGKSVHDSLIKGGHVHQ